MLPAKIDDSNCRHLKVYKEKHLMKKPAAFHWRCVHCNTEGVGDDKVEFIYTYEGLLKIRKPMPYKYNEE